MSNRITEKQLEYLVSRINELTDSPKEPWNRTGDKFKANIGNYHLSYAYGGVCLMRHVNEGGGVNCPLVSYHEPKRDLYNRLTAFISGLENEKS